MFFNFLSTGMLECYWEYLLRLVVKIMYKAIPEVNKPVRTRELLLNRRIHLKHLDELRPMNLTTIHESSSQSLNNKKREMLTEDRMTEIERENRILLSKISDIMHSKKHGGGNFFSNK